MPAGAFALRIVFGRVPANVTKIPDVSFLAKDGLDHHQQPLIDRINQNDRFALLPFLDRLADPCSRALLLAMVHDRAERDIGVVDRAPFARQTVKALRKRKGHGSKNLPNSASTAASSDGGESQ